METYDPGREQQVWQRVMAQPEGRPQNDLRELHREAMELAAVYRGLTANLTGRPKELAKHLQTGEQANAAALSGIEALTRQGQESLKLWQPGKEPARKVLERCYHRSRRCMTEYMARSADGEFGVVFERLAKREGEHCAVIAELLGSMK